ncbi:MAG: hypothetical protein AAF437_09985 [Pseudomonadota bacterium]
MKSIFAFLVAAALAACATSTGAVSSRASEHIAAPESIFFIGQDLEALRGYYASDCCSAADGTTAYLSLYDLRTAPGFGGLGRDLDGNSVSPETSWGSGPVDAYKSVEAFQAPHLAIGLYIAENGHQNGLQRIAEGEFDAEILRLSELMKSVPGQVFLRIGYEFDGVWNLGQSDPGNYIAAYRRIVDVIRADGVTNGVFVWQASASILDDLIERQHEDIRLWFPGDDYVDWLALSWFSLPDATATVAGAYEAKKPKDLADEIAVFARQLDKPVLIAESAPQGYDIARKFRANINPLLDGPSGENRTSLSSEELWQEWYVPLFDWMHENRDVVRGLAYINVNWDGQPMWGPPYQNGFWGDSRLQENPEIAVRFVRALENWKQSR